MTRPVSKDDNTVVRVGIRDRGIRPTTYMYMCMYMGNRPRIWGVCVHRCINRNWPGDPTLEDYEGFPRKSGGGGGGGGGGGHEKERMVVSVWLLPPEPVLSSLRSQMDLFADEHGTPKFTPHVTLLASIGESLERPDRRASATSLLERFSDWGGVPCHFSEVSAGRDPSGEAMWYQSAAAVAVEGPELTTAHRFARHLFLGVAEDAPVAWAPPLSRPHLSLAYGNTDAMRSSLAPPDAFVADTVALWDATPNARPEDVWEWTEIARVSLVGDCPEGAPAVAPCAPCTRPSAYERRPEADE